MRGHRIRKSALGKKTAAILMGTLAGILVVEGGLRLAGWVVGLPQDRSNRVAAEDGMAYRIMTLGESTTAGGKSWPFFLETILNEEAGGRRFQVFNAAVPGTSSPFILAELEGNLTRYKPQLVITMMGVNDDYQSIYWEGDLEKSPAGFLRRTRIYKVFRRAKESFSRKESPVFEESPPMEPEELASMTRAAEACREKNGFDRADKIFRETLKRTRHDFLIRAWHRCLRLKGGEGAARKIIGAVSELSPDDPVIWLALGELYLEHEEIDPAEESFLKVVALNPSLPRSYQRLAEIYRRRREGREFVERFLSSNLDYLRVGEQKEVSEVTGYHYRKLHKALSSRGIRHLAMQYPIKPLRELEDQLKGAEGVVFLGNEKNFASALELGRWDEYFIDRFATVFGHTTEKGSRLIAENASAAVRKIVAAAKNYNAFEERHDGG